MTEELISGLVCLPIGLTLLVWPRPIATYFCRIFKEVWKDDKENNFARGTAICWRAVASVFFRNVDDEATAPTIVRFLGFLYLLIGLCLSIVFSS